MVSGPVDIGELKDYERRLLALVSDKTITPHHACARLFSTMVTLLAYMEDPAERESHMDIIEMKFRETVYEAMRARPKWKS
jgi:hypothetical protein